eukprot:5428963-Pyramimonas_sp.AAC.1
MVLTLGIYCLPSCEWFSRWVYSASPADPVRAAEAAGGVRGDSHETPLAGCYYLLTRVLR